MVPAPVAGGVRVVPAVLLVAVLLAVPAAAQQAVAGRADALHVFFECSGGFGGGCDQRQFRTDIDWVNWMRDRQDAEVHVIVTTQRTGSGGSVYSLDFIGLGDLEGVQDRLTYTSLGTDVRDETVAGVGRALAVGLARYSLLAGAPTELSVNAEVAPMTDRLVSEDEVDDPWDFWVFRVDVNADLEGETTRSERELRGGFDATRTTLDWKLEFRANGSFSRDEIELSDSTIVDSRREWDLGATAVHSLAEHWSMGMEARASAATATNQDFSVSALPTLEYSVWPYEESPRRSLRARYRIGVRHFNYEETTLFGFDEETRFVEELSVSINQRQPWGSVFADVRGSHYLYDLSKYQVSTGGFLSFRIVRGLNLRVNGRVAWIRDQLYLAAEGVSDEEILLERRRLESNFDWDFGVGLSFQFGSIYNNVVNNRF